MSSLVFSKRCAVQSLSTPTLKSQRKVQGKRKERKKFQKLQQEEKLRKLRIGARRYLIQKIKRGRNSRISYTSGKLYHRSTEHEVRNVD